MRCHKQTSTFLLSMPGHRIRPGNYSVVVLPKHVIIFFSFFRIVKIPCKYYLVLEWNYCFTKKKKLKKLLFPTTFLMSLNLDSIVIFLKYNGTWEWVKEHQNFEAISKTFLLKKKNWLSQNEAIFAFTKIDILFILGENFADSLSLQLYHFRDESI